MESINKEEYIIISKTAIEKKIQELELTYKNLHFTSRNTIGSMFEYKINLLQQILSQSTPLIPEIEKAFDEGFNSEEEIYKGNPTGKIIGKEDYISNLKLDI